MVQPTILAYGPDQPSDRRQDNEVVCDLRFVAVDIFPEYCDADHRKAEEHEIAKYHDRGDLVVVHVIGCSAATLLEQIDKSDVSFGSIELSQTFRPILGFVSSTYAIAQWPRYRLPLDLRAARLKNKRGVGGRACWKQATPNGVWTNACLTPAV